MAKIDFKDYYSVLDVDRTADDKALRTAFRKLARKHHPDINPGDAGAEERFKEVNEAYEVLSDPDKRKLYDRFGEDWQRYKEAGYTGDETFEQQRSAQDFGSWYSGQSQQGRQQYDFGGGTSGYSDFFDSMFGDIGSSRGGRSTYSSRQPRPQRGQDMEATVDVTFDEAFKGTTRRFDIQTQDVCPECSGTGFIGNRECSECDGYGAIDRVRSIEVTIPPGVDTGSKVRIAGQGGRGASGGPNGDVYINVNVKPDPRFARNGSNLTTTIKVPLYTALLGGEAMVPTPTGKVALTIPKGTQQGRTFRLRGQGMPKLKSKDQSRGDLIARAEVEIPTSLSAEETALFEQLRDLEKGATG